MTEHEEIDLLRRQIALLEERLARLEARPTVPVYVPIGTPVPQPYVPLPWTVPLTAPWTAYPPVTCGSPGTGEPLPWMPKTTCISNAADVHTQSWN